MIEYNYYWYHHNVVPVDVREKINEAIIGHNFKKFTYYLKKGYCKPFYAEYNGRIELVECFPLYILKTLENGDVKSIKLNEKNFNLITFAEYEHG